jgi:hypothetical protein
MGNVADWRERILILRIRNVDIDIDLRGDHSIATPDVQNHPAAVWAKEAILMFELGDQLPLRVFDCDRTTLRVDNRFTLGLEIRHLD